MTLFPGGYPAARRMNLVEDLGNGRVRQITGAPTVRIRSLRVTPARHRMSILRISGERAGRHGKNFASTNLRCLIWRKCGVERARIGAKNTVTQNEWSG